MYIYTSRERKPQCLWLSTYLGLVTFVSCLDHALTAGDFKFPDAGRRLELSPEKSVNVVESLKKIGDLFDKAEEQNKKDKTDCEFKCPEGSMALARPKHKVYSDGCGSPDNKFDFPVVPEIDKCCDTHDICYGTFGEEKQNCDRHLHKCLEVACKEAMKSLGYKGSQKQGCTMMSKLLLGSVMSSSCQEYKSLQEKATLCQTDTDDGQEEETSDDNLMRQSDGDLGVKSDKKSNEDDVDDDFVNVEVEDGVAVGDKDVVYIDDDVQQRDEL